MNNQLIKVKFIYDDQKTNSVNCKLDEKIKEVCQKFTKQNLIDFNKVQFLLSGKVLEKNDYDKPLSQFFSSSTPYNLVLLVVDSSKMTDIITLKNKNVPDNSNNQTNDNANTKKDNNNNNLNSDLNILTNNNDKIPFKDNTLKQS